jgi:hypothetical protein
MTYCDACEALRKNALDEGQAGFVACAACRDQGVVAVELDVAGDDDGPWCHTCPLWDAEWAACNAVRGEDGKPRSTTTDDGNAPAWCPLRVGVVVVSSPKTSGRFVDGGSFENESDGDEESP